MHKGTAGRVKDRAWNRATTVKGKLNNPSRSRTPFPPRLDRSILQWHNMWEKWVMNDEHASSHSSYTTDVCHSRVHGFKSSSCSHYPKKSRPCTIRIMGGSQGGEVQKHQANWISFHEHLLTFISKLCHWQDLFPPLRWHNRNGSPCDFLI